MPFTMTAQSNYKTDKRKLLYYIYLLIHRSLKQERVCGKYKLYRIVINHNVFETSVSFFKEVSS